MKKIILIAMMISLAACSSKSKKDADIKDQDIRSQLEKSEAIDGTTTLGVNEDKDIILQDKVQLSEHLRQLVAEVKHKQDEMYGSKRFGSRGLYGRLEKCVTKNKTQPLVPREILVKDKELGQLEAGKFGYDEKGRLVALDEVKLRDKIRDLEDKKRRLYEKEEELLSELSRCEAH